MLNQTRNLGHVGFGFSATAFAENINKSNIQIFIKEDRTRITLITYLMSLNGVICCNIFGYPAINAPPLKHLF